MKPTLLLFLIGLTLFACNNADKSHQIEFDVNYYGALKNMMHKGDLSSKVKLSEFAKTKNLYGLGACENLKGEIQIFDGESFNSYVENDSLIIDKSFNKNAALFVYSEVENWQSFTIPINVKTYSQLESFIAKTAADNNIDIEQPFPFLVEGTAQSFDWHVINWKDGDAEHTHEKHVTSGLHGSVENTKVELLGFYSNSHHTIFTHLSTNMHVHVRTDDNKLAGHVDDITIGNEMILKLPLVTKD